MIYRPYAIFLNGECMDTNLGLAHLINRGMKFGDGIFETMRVASGEILYWKYHAERLRKGCQLLQFEVGDANDFLTETEQRIKKAIAFADGHKLLRIRLSVVRNGGGTGYLPDENGVMLLIEVNHAPPATKKPPLNLSILYDYPIVPSPLTAIKSLNRLPNVLGMMQFPGNAVLLNTHGRIAETLNGNIFFIENDDLTIVTPPITEGAIDGVMRAVILDKISSVKERCITVDELSDFNACFSTNVPNILTKVAGINENNYDTTHPMIIEILLRL